METVLRIIYDFNLILSVVALPLFLAGLVLMGFFRLCKRLPEGLALTVKFLTSALLLMMGLVGLNLSFELLPYILIAYLLPGALGGIGCYLLFSHNNDSSMQRLMGGSLLWAAILPFALVGLIYSGNAFFKHGDYLFRIENHSGSEIVLREIEVGGQVLFIGEYRMSACPQPGPLRSKNGDWFKSLSAYFSRKPKEIRLRVYDVDLGKEVQGEVRLPQNAKHPACAFDIVYDQDGFRYDYRPCG